MSKTFVLYRKELRSLFSSWIAYVVLIAFILLSGVAFYISLEVFTKAVKSAPTMEEAAVRQAWSILEYVIYPVYRVVFMLLFVFVPAITMRSFAEEKRQRTYELLLTSPVSVPAIVLSKYLAAATLITAMILPVAMFPGIVIKYGSIVDKGPMATGFLGLFLLGYSLAAIGVFASSLTENQIVAFIIAVALEMTFFLLNDATATIDILRFGDVLIDVGGILRTLSISDHFEPLLAGIMRLHDLVYFLCLIVFWLWATTKSVESARWG